MWSSSISFVSVVDHLLSIPSCAGLATDGTSMHSSHSAKVGQGQFEYLLAMGRSLSRGLGRKRCSNAEVGTGASFGRCLRLGFPMVGLVVTMVGISWEDSRGVLSALLPDSAKGCTELGSSGISGRLSGPDAAQAWRAGASCSSWPLASAAYYFPYQSCHFEFTCPVSSRLHFFLFLIKCCHFSCRNLRS